MFLICTKTKTIQKTSGDKPDNVTTFETLDEAKAKLIYKIQVEIAGLKLQVVNVKNLTFDDVAQTSLF